MYTTNWECAWSEATATTSTQCHIYCTKYVENNIDHYSLRYCGCVPFASKACFKASTSTLVCLLFSSLRFERLACIDNLGFCLNVTCNVAAPVDDKMPPIDDVRFLAASTISTSMSLAVSTQEYYSTILHKLVYQPVRLLSLALAR